MVFRVYHILNQEKLGWFFILLYFFLTFPFSSNALQHNSNIHSFGADTVKTGTVSFKTEADSIYLYVDENYKKLVTLSDKKSLDLKSGYHKLYIFGKNFNEKDYLLEVKPDTTISLSLPKLRSKFENPEVDRSAYARLKRNANLIIETDQETSILIDGEPLGSGFAKENLNTGTYRLRLEHHSGRSKTELITVQKHRLTHVEYFFLPSKKKAKAYSFFPGASQLHKRQYVKAGAFFIATGALFTFSISNSSSFNFKRDQFDQLRVKYKNTSDEAEALALGEQLDELKNTVNKYEQRRNLFFVAAGLLYVFNIYDAFQRPKSGYRRTNTINPFKNIGVNLSDKNPSISFRVDF